MKKYIIIFISIITIVIINACTSKTVKMESDVKDFIRMHVNEVKPVYVEANLSYWNASISGKDEDFQKSADLNLKLRKIYSRKADFETVKNFRESNLVENPELKRQLDVLYNSYLGNQIDTVLLEKIVKLESEVEKKFSNFRTEVDGHQLTDNDVEEILKTSTSSDEVMKVWLAHKKIGTVVAQDVITLVKMRNEAAKSIGFSNYHEMRLKLGEQDPQEIEILFDELDNLTRDEFSKLKTNIDDYLAAKFKIDKSKLMPWHYQNRYFQEAPKIYTVDLDTYYKDKDVVELTRNYFEGIGLPVEDILKNSDLYEKEGKNQHAYCTDINNEGDVRILCNVKNNHNWMGTMLHETGHAVYEKFMPESLPFLLKDPAHTFTTEAIAMMFGRMASNPQWMKDMLGISDTGRDKIAGDCYNSLKLEQLVFSRWAQVMYRFEKAMYENPDQDLNKLWWTLVEKYQMIKTPEGRNEPDWASKYHVALVPCYYHNYLLGELLASQLQSYICTNIIKSDKIFANSFAGNKEVGTFLKEKVFAPANLFYWNEMIEKATGEKLTPKYYAKQFVE